MHTTCKHGWGGVSLCASFDYKVEKHLKPKLGYLMRFYVTVTVLGLGLFVRLNKEYLDILETDNPFRHITKNNCQHQP